MKLNFRGLPLIPFLLVLGLPVVAMGQGAASLQLVGEAPAKLADDIKALAPLLAGQSPHTDDPAALLAQLQGNIPAIRLLLNNYGYYDPVITLEATPDMQLHIDLGPRYHYGTYVLHSPFALAPRLTLPPGEPAVALRLRDNEDAIVSALAELGYPLAKLENQTYVVDHDARALSAEITVDPGLQLAFGTLDVRGNQRTRTTFIKNRVPWKVGQVYSNAALAAYRSDLLASELFSAVKLVPATTPAPDGTLPIQVEVVERQPRTIGASAAYNTDRGPGAEAFWQHRNLRGSGEKLDVKGQYYLDLQSLSAALRVPDLPDRRTVLLLSLKGENQASDAYNSTGITAEAGFERSFTKRWKGSVGTRLFSGSVNNAFTTDVSLPVAFSFDSSNSTLDPTKGARASFSLTPHSALAGGQAFYAVWESRLAGYQSLTAAHNVVLAGWMHVGGLLGAGVDDVPPTSRFYAGGGGSVRGYEFRSIGERDANGDPLGGTAILEGGAELRIRLSEKVGAVVFAEGGSVSDTTVPDFSRPQYAAGLGLRYLTDFAPLRADIAVPLNPRNNEAAFQFYISIGQAF